jgi:hypothetical protein
MAGVPEPPQAEKKKITHSALGFGQADTWLYSRLGT